MGIYIKGMDFLPEDGTEFVVKKDEYGTWIKPIGHMGFSMRLIELPENHGDLIDRDAFRADFSMGENCDKCGIELKRCEYDRNYTKMDFCGWLDDAPTVIEAEGSEDE